MANDMTTGSLPTTDQAPHTTDETCSAGDPSLSTEFSLSAGYLSYLNDDPGKEWERGLLTDPAGVDRTGRQQTRETLALMWNTGDLTTAPDQASFLELTADSGFSASPVEPADYEMQRFSSAPAGTRLSSGRTSQNSAPAGTSHTKSNSGSLADEYVKKRTMHASGSGAASRAGSTSSTGAASRAGAGSASRSGSDSRSGAASLAGAGSASRTAAYIAPTYPRPRQNPASVLFRVVTLIIILIAAGLFLLRSPFTGFPIPGFNFPSGSGTDGTDETENVHDIFEVYEPDDAGFPDDYENPYPDGQVLTDFGSRFSDFYAPKYIASYEIRPSDEDVPDESGAAGTTGTQAPRRYQELCVIDPAPFIGTSDEPLYFDGWLSDHLSSTRYSVCHEDFRLYPMNTGFSVQYTDDQQYYTYPDTNYLLPSATSDRDAFFVSVRRDLKDPPFFSSFSDNYNDVQFSKVRKANIAGHELYYMETTFTDRKDREFFDVVSFEKKPLGCAFITEYRDLSENSFSDGIEALEWVYSMLTFYQDDFDSVDAYGSRFTSARIYNDRNSASATIDVTDPEFLPLQSGTMMFKDSVEFELGEYGMFDEPSCEIVLRFNEGSTAESYGGYEAWAQEMLEDEQPYGNYPRTLPAGSLKEFTYKGCKARHLVFDGTDEIYNVTEKIRHHKCLIELPEGGELELTIKFIHDVHDEFDIVKFLDERITLEH